jgi:hypothetical protein
MPPEKESGSSSAPAQFTTTKERILDAASKCPEVARTLKILFPEAFTPEHVNVADAPPLRIGGETAMAPRNGGEFYVRGFWLNTVKFNWSLERDGAGELVLVPTRK